MTLQEVSGLYYLKKLIERDEVRIAELESKLGLGAIQYTGMPKAPTSASKMEELVPVIADLRDRLVERQRAYRIKQMEIERYISSVEDYQIRLIMLFRFVDLLSWRQIAQRIGGGNTEEGVKKLCYRFIKKSEKSESCPKCPE